MIKLPAPVNRIPTTENARESNACHRLSGQQLIVAVEGNRDIKSGRGNQAPMRLLLLAFVVTTTFGQTPPGSNASSLDFEFFKTRVQPIFLAKRPGHARCYACHSTATPFRLQRLSPGATKWNDEQSRLNFEAAQREVVAGNLQASHLLMHPLAEKAGGDLFHSGGKHWDSQDNPEWQAMAEWVRGRKAAPSR
jgi:hypothetical protein